MARVPAKFNHDMEIRAKVLTSAKRLFIGRGYTRTTIRQIVEDSGVMIGSIYHFFKNKEDIFKSLMQELLNQSSVLVEERFGDESRVIQFAIVFLIELEATHINEQVREMFFEGYTLTGTFEERIRTIAGYSKELFVESLPKFTDDDYFARALLIKGSLRSCIAAYYFQGEVDNRANYRLLLRMMLPLYGVKEKEISGLIDEIETLHPKVHEVALELINRVSVG